MENSGVDGMCESLNKLQAMAAYKTEMEEGNVPVVFGTAEIQTILNKPLILPKMDKGSKKKEKV